MNAKKFYHFMDRLIDHCRVPGTAASAGLKLLAGWAESFQDPIRRDVEEMASRDSLAVVSCGLSFGPESPCT